MAIIRRCNPRYYVSLLFLISSLLSGCGLTQRVSDSTVSLTKAIFFKQIKTLHLDFIARAAVNRNQQGIPLTTMVRIYQLSSAQAFKQADYQQLFASDSQLLSADLLAEKAVRIRPDSSVAIDVPLEKNARYIGIAAMFIQPDQTRNSWRLLLPKSALDADKARQIALVNNQLILLKADKER